MRTLLEFESLQPLSTRFFTQALISNHLVNAYILRGKDFTGMYNMILCLAQVVNCSEKPDILSACGQCQTCRWIEANAHPGVITVSNLTYLADIDTQTGTSKTKSGKSQQSLVVGQLEILMRELSLHSGGFRRIVILTGAQEVPLEEGCDYAFPHSLEWGISKSGQVQWLPLDRRMFKDTLANKFLKTLEEPPRDAIFFLLTDAEEKLLETIVSRCQLVPFATPPSFAQISLPPDARETFSQLYQGQHDFLTRMQVFSAYLSTGEISATEALTHWQQFLREQMNQSASNPAVFTRLKTALSALDHARRMIEDKVREESVLEDLFLKI
jgi:DNA polymerase III, delta subunit